MKLCRAVFGIVEREKVTHSCIRPPKKGEHRTKATAAEDLVHDERRGIWGSIWVHVGWQEMRVSNRTGSDDLPGGTSEGRRDITCDCQWNIRSHIWLSSSSHLPHEMRTLGSNISQLVASEDSGFVLAYNYNSLLSTAFCQGFACPHISVLSFWTQHGLTRNIGRDWRGNPRQQATLLAAFFHPVPRAQRVLATSLGFPL
ncbi:hypothetical protein V8F20_001578 [Naviculisporaceae sp. PSN 640]